MITFRLIVLYILNNIIVAVDIYLNLPPSLVVMFYNARNLIGKVEMSDLVCTINAFIFAIFVNTPMNS